MASLQERMSRLVKSIRIVRKNDILFRGVPAIGFASYCAYSAKFLVPREFSRVCGDNSLILSNILLFNSTIGNILYLYSRKHILNLDNDGEKYLYSTFASVIFNFGSILFWCISKVYLPENDVIRLTYALLSSVSFLYIAKNYLSIVDGE